MNCALALVLLLDVSMSVTEERWIQQRNGHANAFNSEKILEHIERGNPIVVSVAAFSEDVNTIVDWRILRNREDLISFSQEIIQIQRPSLGIFTFINRGIRFSLDLLQQELPCTPERLVVDVAADGNDDRTDLLEELRLEAQSIPVQINGLAIAREGVPEIINRNLVEFFREHVVTVDGFVVRSDGFSDIERAVRRKLEIEIIGGIGGFYRIL